MSRDGRRPEMHYTISNGALSVQIRDLGAELWSIRSRDGAEYLWQSLREDLFPCASLGKPADQFLVRGDIRHNCERRHTARSDLPDCEPVENGALRMDAADSHRLIQIHGLLLRPWKLGQLVETALIDLRHLDGAVKGRNGVS